MNIKEAKEEIRDSIKAYFLKDKFGQYRIPIEKQRPIFLIGAPGIGKTAIMEQIAQELNVGLVSYSMTHHTRQSALGLPFISHKTYGGKDYEVSEYTMSEIIASVYDMMEETGVTEGILFLDEINCVSETLAPSMLQFLQYKVFGRHQVPQGWVVVTAGNPPEYNSSVREFDIVTWDRLKRMDVEPDFDVWKEYAYQKGIHPSILTYLEIRKNDFYHISTTIDGKQFVTARGWSDLSEMIQLYELQGTPVRERMIQQYVQDSKIAKNFANYYDLFNKYKSDYQVEAILSGKAGDTIVNRAQEAKFDERLSLIGLLLDGLSEEMHQVLRAEDVMNELLGDLKKARLLLARPNSKAVDVLGGLVAEREEKINNGKKSGAMSGEQILCMKESNLVLEDLRHQMEEQKAIVGDEAFQMMKKEFDKFKKTLTKQAKKAGESLTNAIEFCEKAFGEGQEMLILITELTINRYGAKYISHYGCEAYFKHNKDLLFYERQKEIIGELEGLDLNQMDFED